MTIINETTFEAAAEQAEGSHFIKGTVEVTLRNETRRVRALKTSDGEITAYGMVGRYQTGTKAWPASVSQRTNPNTGKKWDSVWFGRDDRAGKFKKENCLFFAD